MATQPDMTVWIEMASTYPYPNNGFFLDLPGLYALNETAAVPQAAVSGGTAAVAAQPAAPLPTIAPPEPREDGSVVHTVQSGDTLWVIAIQYADSLGKTPEETLAYLEEINNLSTFLNVGDEILISPATSGAPAEEAPATDETTTDDVAATPEAPVEGETGETVAEAPVEGEVPAEGEVVAEATAAPEGVVLETAPETAPAEVIAGTICVAAFDDANANGLREAEEPLVANAAIAIARGGATVSTYITDGMSEPYCFTLAEPDSYQMTIYPPADYTPTTESSWAVAVANGESYTVSFGLQSAQAVASTDNAAANPDAATAEDAGSTGNALMDNLGFIVLGVAGVLVLMAIAGVVLLRRG
ncbi:MAG: LysM peptidoglycan-binding domain-containing protein [Chloroflexota bacterium]